MKCKLKDFCTVINGRAYSQKELLDKGKYRVLRVGNFFSSDRWYFSDLELPAEKYCNKGDLLFAWACSFGPRIWNGEDRTIFHYHIWKLDIDSNIVDKMYLFYLLKISVDSMTAGTHGSVMMHITKSDMENFEFDIPTLEVQKKIAAILSALDEKIATNREINDNLQQQAMALYRQMFVETNNDARRECRADEYFDISIGKTPPRKEAQWFSMNPIDCIWVSISDMGRCGMYIADSSEYLTHESVDKFNIKVVPDNTVLLSFKLTVGRVAITDGAMATNEAIAHFKTDKPEINEYLYCYLKDFNYQTMGSTSSIATAVNSKIIKAMPFVAPTDAELVTFHSATAPMFEMIKTRQRENTRLAELRDSLLPKLMSGEIDVSAVQL